jgi:heme A synthase
MDRLARYAWLVLAYNVAVILWGAIVRATGSGAGCGNHWPLCNGEIVSAAPAVATLVELAHRLTSGVALLSVVVLVVWVFKRRPAGDPARGAATAAGVFILGEAAVGAGLVLFELVAENRSLARGLFMATHLVNTLFLLAALTVTAHHASGGARPRVRGRGSLALVLLVAFVLMLLVGASGAIAALGDTLFPSKSLAEALAQDASATSHLLIRLRMLHPFLALGAGAWLLGTASYLRRRYTPLGGVRYADWVQVLVLIQIGAGLLNVMLLAPVWLQVVHLLLADLVWIALVLFAGVSLALPPPPAALPVEARASVAALLEPPRA